MNFKSPPDAGGLFQQLSLLRLRHVAVPAVDGDPGFLTQFVQPAELVVDQRLERRDIEHTDALRRILVKQGKDREERRFRLAGGGGSRQQHVAVRAEDRFTGGILNAAKVLPAGAVDKILHKRRVSVKHIHIVNSAKPSSA